MSPSDVETTASPSTGLAWRLHELLLSTSHGEGRRLSFLAIDPARKHFGTEWPRVAVKVHGIVASTLSSFLSEGDIYAPADEFSYIIMSSNKASDDFDKLMEEISAEISSRLTGKGIAKDLVCIVHLNAGTDTGQAHHPVPQELDTAAHIGNIERIISKAEASTQEFDIKSISHDLIAVLQTNTMTASSSICWAVRLDEDRIRHHGYAILPSQADPILYAEIDALTVEFASKQLKDSMDRHLIVQIPVHRLTLSSKKYREMYLKICHGLLANRKERVIFDIHGIDEGTPSNRISEYMQWLRPYGRAIAITVDLDFSTISAFSGLNAASIGADLRAVDSDLAFQKAGKFINRVKTANLKSHIHGIVSKAQADLCLKLGTDYLDGDLISEGLI